MPNYLLTSKVTQFSRYIFFVVGVFISAKTNTINGEIFAYELKLNKKVTAKFSTPFIDFYESKEMNVVHRENFSKWMRV